MKDAPIYRDTYSFCGVMLDELGMMGHQPELRERLARGALRLLDRIVLAVEGIDRHDNLLDADAELRLLRTHLRLALDLVLLEEGVFLDLVEQADLIGRQLGGWLNKLERVSSESRGVSG
jgi:hypothetical protein